MSWFTEAGKLQWRATREMRVSRSRFTILQRRQMYRRLLSRVCLRTVQMCGVTKKSVFWRLWKNIISDRMRWRGDWWIRRAKPSGLWWRISATHFIPRLLLRARLQPATMATLCFYVIPTATRSRSRYFLKNWRKSAWTRWYRTWQTKSMRSMSTAWYRIFPCSWPGNWTGRIVIGCR